ncbi:hypothetical protein HY990_00995 [Candidatus Micrarchaeota archaeon]|nr:hypothetical protein [Candidatus Micrarchaeota archaeon]
MNISNRFNLGPFMTFEHSKTRPIYDWFWYKEGYASELVDFALDNEKLSPNPIVLDPFCGVGTTLLRAKERGIFSLGVDASSLATFVSKTKTSDYSESDLNEALEFLSRPLDEGRTSEWEFELFPARAAFPKRNYSEILSLRSAIDLVENDSVSNLLLLALISILPQASIILKDGGVLKIDKKKRALPAKEIFRRRVKKFVNDLKTAKTGFCPQVLLGDARNLDIESNSIDLVVTSPPYLNNIDYSKIYGLELSLLEMSKAAAAQMRMRALRSYIGKNMDVQDMPPEVGEIGARIPIIGTYFRDMDLVISQMFRVLKDDGVAHVNVSNSVIHETHVLVDEVFAEMAERIGFSQVEIVVGAERIADVRPAKVKTRESIVIMRK